MAEQTKRQQLEAHLATRAIQDAEFRDRLLKDPKAAIEEEIGLRFPEGVQVVVHEERLNQLHVVLPIDLFTSEDPLSGPFWLKH
jgi:hypothetical protein